MKIFVSAIKFVVQFQSEVIPSFVLSSFQLQKNNFLSVCSVWTSGRTDMDQDNSNEKESRLSPPSHVKGMTILDRSAFSKTVKVPYLSVSTSTSYVVVKILKSYLLKMLNFKSMQENESDAKFKHIYLNPDLVKCFDDFNDVNKNKLVEIKVEERDLHWKHLDFHYDNWNADDILKAVLPSDKRVSGYSIIGHILHLNLKNELFEYKQLIGQVLLDKKTYIRTVVNKTDIIDSTYRYFTMEILSGENDMNVCAKENGCTYKFDFSKVYWNPRLSTEHFRIVSKLQSGDVLFDVFAGVGPFAIPAAKKKCIVFANDLNPNSYEWLCSNAVMNKVSSYIKTYNMDGRGFIKQVIKSTILEFWKQKTVQNMHIVMNLPATAVEFLDVFIGLFCDTFEEIYVNLPIIHCYCFVKDATNHKEKAQEIVEAHLQHSLEANLEEVAYVRNVAPNKEMMRVSFKVPNEVIFKNLDYPVTKKARVSEV